MAVNKLRDRAIAKENYGDSEKIISSEIRFPGLVNVSIPVAEAVREANGRARWLNSRSTSAERIDSVNVPAYYREGTKCFCPECRKITDAVRVEGTQFGNSEVDSLYECGGCGYVDRMIVPSSRRVDTGTKKVDDKEYPYIAFRIPFRRDAFLSSKDDRFTRYVDSCTYYEYEFVQDGHQRGFSRHVMRTILDINGQSRSVQQMTMDGDGNLLSVHHTADSLNPNYHITRFPQRGSGLGFYHLGDIFRPIVYSNGTNGICESKPMLVRPSGSDDDITYVDIAYNFISDHYGLPNDVGVSNDTKMAILQLSIMYSGVMDLEMGTMNTNQLYAKKRGEAVPDDEFKQQKMSRLFEVKEKIALIDHNISSDLSKLKTADEVTAYLRSIVFGEKPSIKLPKLTIDVKKSEKLDDGYKGGKLKKAYSKDPYGTASNVRTARKMNVQDINHVNQLFGMLDTDGQRSHKNGVLYPIETRNQMRLVRSMQKYRDIARVIDDIYGLDEDGQDKITLFEDSANMYAELMQNGAKIASSIEESLMVKYLDFLHKIEDFVATEEAVDEYIASGDAPDWGEHTKSVLMEMNDKIKEYKESGLWDEMYFTTRDGLPLFARPMKEEFDEKAKQKVIANPRNNLTEDSPIEAIKAAWTDHGLHAELLHMSQNSVGNDKNRVNVKYRWSKEAKEKIERDYGDYKFRLAKDSNDLIICGRKSNLDVCIGLAGYDKSVQQGRSAIVMMMKRNGDYCCAIEMSPDFKRFYQFKAYQNGPCFGPAVPVARQWIEDIGANPNGCRDIERFDESLTSYHGRSWSVAEETLEDEVPEKQIRLRDLSRGEVLADKISNEMLEEKKRAEAEKAKNADVAIR